MNCSSSARDCALVRYITAQSRSSQLAARHQPPNLVDDEARLLFLVVRLVQRDLLAAATLGPELLVLAPAGVTPHDALRGVENVLRRAIVLFEHDDAHRREVALKVTYDSQDSLHAIRRSTDRRRPRRRYSYGRRFRCAAASSRTSSYCAGLVS